MEGEKPQAEHEWLHQLIGTWSYEAECDMGGQQFKSTGTVTYRSLGGLWVIGEGTGMCASIMTLGYNPAQKKYVGSFIAEQMTHLWPYLGAREGNVLTLDSTGPSFSGDGTMAQYQDVIAIESPDRHTLTARLQGSDGTWKEFMKTVYTRTK